MRVLSFILVVSIFAVPMPFALQGFAQKPPKNVPISEPLTQSVKEPLAFGLPDGTPVKLRINRTISSADAKTGETVDFEVLEDIKIGETVIIPRGGIALGTVTRGKPKGRFGVGGKLDINIDSARTVAGGKIALRAVKETAGKGSTVAMTGAMVATGILFFPAAPLFLFLKGKDITIPKGTEITAYVNGDSSLDPKQFFATNSAPDSGNPLSTDQKQTIDLAATSEVSVKSTPDGAEIEVDGKFVGNTPSTLKLGAGDHKITIGKSGYAMWERTITLTAGSSIVIDASMVKNP